MRHFELKVVRRQQFEDSTMHTMISCSIVSSSRNFHDLGFLILIAIKQKWLNILNWASEAPKCDINAVISFRFQINGRLPEDIKTKLDITER